MFSKFSLFIIILISIGVGVFMSYTTAVEVLKSEDGKFCAQCHTMKPMADAHYKSTHGGNNKYGISAQCVDCHLPHDTLYNYLKHKIKFGAGDTMMELLGNTKNINWNKKREHASSFVFNSGCLTCHNNLDHSLMENVEPEIVKKIEDKNLKVNCIECHDVGHKWK